MWLPVNLRFWASARKDWLTRSLHLMPPVAPTPTPACALFVLRWICIGVAAFWLAHFVSSGLTLALSSEDFTNAHGAEAREHFLGFIVLANLKLLKAYAIAILGYALLAFPVALDVDAMAGNPRAAIQHSLANVIDCERFSVALWHESGVYPSVFL